MSSISRVLLPLLTLGSAAGLGTASGAPGQADAQAAEMARLQGEWSMVSGASDGQVIPDFMAHTGRRVAKGNETTATIGGVVVLKATFGVDPSKRPKTIDYVALEGPDQGRTLLGIYELAGDTLRTCFARAGQERPAEFATQAGDQRTLTVWLRIRG